MSRSSAQDIKEFASYTLHYAISAVGSTVVVAEADMLNGFRIDHMWMSYESNVTSTDYYQVELALGGVSYARSNVPGEIPLSWNDIVFEPGSGDLTLEATDVGPGVPAGSTRVTISITRF